MAGGGGGTGRGVVAPAAGGPAGPRTEAAVPRRRRPELVAGGEWAGQGGGGGCQYGMDREGNRNGRRKEGRGRCQGVPGQQAAQVAGVSEWWRWAVRRFWRVDAGSGGSGGGRWW